MSKKTIRFFFLSFASITLALGAYFAFINLYEITQAISGHNTEWEQMTLLSRSQEITYSLVYMLLFLILIVFISYSLYISKKRSVLFFSILLWVLMFVEIYTDMFTTIGI